MPNEIVELQAVLAEHNLAQAEFDRHLENSIQGWLGGPAADFLKKNFERRQQDLVVGIFNDIKKKYFNEKHTEIFSSLAVDVFCKVTGDLQGARKIFSTLDLFANKNLGLLFHSASDGNSSLCPPLVDLLNKWSDSHAEPDALLGFLEFSQKTVGTFFKLETINSETRQGLLKMVGEEALKADDPISACSDMMQKLGKIARVVSEYNAVSQMYAWWLPKCENIEQLNRALSPNREFLVGLAKRRLMEEVNISNYYPMAAYLAYLAAPDDRTHHLDGSWSEPAIPLDPVYIPYHEGLSWLSNVKGGPVGDIERKRGEEIIFHMQSHLDQLKKNQAAQVSSYSLIDEGRRFGLEFFLHEIVASENEREPELNLQICSEVRDMGHCINELASKGEIGQKERYLTHVSEGGPFHCIGYEATVVAPAQIYIRGFEPTSESVGKEFFDIVVEQMTEACRGKNVQFKLDVYATGQQNALAGCDFFSLSFLLKSLDENFDASAVTFDKNKPFESNLISEEKADVLPIYYFKHAQSREIFDKIEGNLKRRHDLKRAINKKNETLRRRYQEHITTQEVFDCTQEIGDGSQRKVKKTFSDSIDVKRIVFYERAIKTLQKRLLTASAADEALQKQ